MSGRGKQQYDVELMVKLLLDNQLANRHDLRRDFIEAFQGIPICKIFLANVLQEALSQVKGPAEILMAGAIYGMILGVNAEKFRAAKEDGSAIVQ